MFSLPGQCAKLGSSPATPSSVETTPTISRLLRQIASDQQRLGITPHIPRRITKRLSRIEREIEAVMLLTIANAN